jgi:Tat protein translocase TatB subunit
MGGFSLIHWLILGLFVLLLFGGNRFSSMMGDVAKGLKSFKQGMADEEDDKKKRYDAQRRLPADEPRPADPIDVTPQPVDPAAPPRDGDARYAQAARLAMFGVDSTEFLIVAALALIFIGPKELPQAMRTLGYWVGKVRGMARHFTSGIETMMREAELEEMERKWREENDLIMKLHPANADYPDPPPQPRRGDDEPPADGDPTPPSERELP